MNDFLTPIERHYATKWEQMTILDDPIFGAVMENERLCQELLRRALPELKIDTVKLVERQHTIIGTLTSHAVRYDVYVRDNRQRNFAVEMQIADQKNLPYRLRYYQDMMDTELLRPGEDYRALAKRPTYVIMFCAFDYYGQGAARYEFGNVNLFDRRQEMGDGRKIVVFNSKAKHFEHASEIRTFLDFMEKRPNTEDSFINDVQTTIELVKGNQERKWAYVKFEADLQYRLNQSREQGIQQGEKQGQAKSATGIIKFLSAQGQSTQEIVANLAQMLNISSEQAQRYYEQTMAHP